MKDPNFMYITSKVCTQTGISAHWKSSSSLKVRSEFVAVTIFHVDPSTSP